MSLYSFNTFFNVSYQFRAISSDKVDTLKFVVAHLDRTAAPGTSGWSYDTLRRLENVDFLRPVIDLFFETDADSKFDDSDPYQHRIHEALISCRGLALNKADPKEPIKVRPIGLPEAFAQIACKCFLAQSTNEWSERLMLETGQLGMEPNGTLLAYRRILRSLEALVAIDRPAGVNISDVGGA